MRDESWRTAISATLHCLTGCAIGEVLGLVLATWWGWSDGPSIALAIVLAFVFGYALTMQPLISAGIPLRQAIRVALAADTLSILTMEIVDNAIVLAVPGAMDAGLGVVALLGGAGARSGRRVRGDGAGQQGADRPREGSCGRPWFPRTRRGRRRWRGTIPRCPPTRRSVTLRGRPPGSSASGCSPWAV